jgi:hypothetical protein
MMKRLAAILLAVLICPTLGFAAELPARKAGLWEMKTTTPDGHNVSMQQCVDAKTDQAMQARFSSNPQANCSGGNVQKTGDTMTIDRQCTVAGRTVNSHAVVTGSFDNGYTMNVTTQGQGMPARSVSIAAKWLGPCAADQKPGDMIMPNGMKMNLLDMPRGAGPPGPPGAPGAMMPQH